MEGSGPGSGISFVCISRTDAMTSERSSNERRRAGPVVALKKWLDLSILAELLSFERDRIVMDRMYARLFLWRLLQLEVAATYCESGGPLPGQIVVTRL